MVLIQPQFLRSITITTPQADTTPEAVHAEYSAMLKALSAVNDFTAAIRKNLPDNTSGVLPTSVRGNRPMRAARYWVEDAWVSGHGSLRKYAGMVGGMLDKTNLANAPELNELEAEILNAQKQYTHAVNAAIDYTSSLSRDANGNRIKRTATGCPLVKNHEGLSELRYIEEIPEKYARQYAQLWQSVSKAEARYEGLMAQIEEYFSQQTEAPIGWKDNHDREHHTLATTPSYPAPANALCLYLWQLHTAATMGQENPLLQTEKTTTKLLAIESTNKVIPTLKDKLLNHVENPSLKAYLVDQFAQQPEIKRLHWMLPSIMPLMPPKDITLHRTADAALKALNAVDALHQHTAHKKPYQPVTQAGHWCTHVIAGLENLPNEIGTRWY